LRVSWPYSNRIFLNGFFSGFAQADMRPGMGVWQAGIDGLQVGHARILRTRGRRLLRG